MFDAFAVRPCAAEIVVACAGVSLQRQLHQWCGGFADPECELAFADTPLAIRHGLRNAAIALVDATERPARALSVFRRIVARLGGYRVGVYSETIHPRLELSVRTEGAQLLFGPLAAQQWQDFFERMLRFGRERQSGGASGQRFARRPLGAHDTMLREQPTVRWSTVGVRRPKTGVK